MSCKAAKRARRGRARSSPFASLSPSKQSLEGRLSGEPSLCVSRETQCDREEIRTGGSSRVGRCAGDGFAHGRDAAGAAGEEDGVDLVGLEARVGDAFAGDGVEAIGLRFNGAIEAFAGGFGV